MIERTCASGPATALATAPHTFVVATTVGVPPVAVAPGSPELPQPATRARTTRVPPAVRAARRAVVMGAPGVVVSEKSRCRHPTSGNRRSRCADPQTITVLVIEDEGGPDDTGRARNGDERWP